MKSSLRLSVTTLALLLMVACAAQQLPAGYEVLRAETTAAEVSSYLKGLREAYISAYRTGKMPADQYLLAIKADESLSVAWRRMLAALKQRQDTYAMWVEILRSTDTLEAIITAWVPAKVLQAKPRALGGK